MRVFIRQPAGRIVECDLGHGSYSVGTDASCEVRLEGAGVAPHHARLSIGAGGVASIEDLGSRHGTRVNDDRVVASGALAPHARITIGSCQLWLGTSQPPLSQIGGAGAPPANRIQPADQAKQPLGALPFTEATRRACRRAHEQLIEQLDLRRRDVSALSDPELRALATDMLRGILAAGSLPEGCDPAAVLRFVLDEALGLGPLEGLLAQEEIGEIMVNGPDDIFVEAGGRLERANVRFSGEAALRGVVERIVAPLGRRVDDASPMVDARLQDGSRVNVIIAPLALRGTAITIRRFGRRRLQAADLITSGALDAPMLQFLAVCVTERRNLLVAGGTGSGKTTLLNILSSLIPRGERVITIEDSAELLFDHPNLVTLETRPANLEGRGEVSVRDLVRNALRMRPDRIVVGECRGGEALDMLQAMNTGHEGSLTTVHANSPRELLSRLEVMVLMSGVDLPVAAIREQIASSIHVIVQQARFACGSRRITRITEVTGIAAGTIQTQDLFRFVPESSARVPDSKVQGRFQATGHLPQFYESIVQAGGAPDLSLFGPASSGAS